MPNSIEYLVEEIVEERVEGNTVVEEVPKGCRGSNGIVERGVQVVEGQTRAIFLSLRDRKVGRIYSRKRSISVK